MKQILMMWVFVVAAFMTATYIREGDTPSTQTQGEQRVFIGGHPVPYEYTPTNPPKLWDEPTTPSVRRPEKEIQQDDGLTIVLPLRSQKWEKALGQLMPRREFSPLKWT